MEAERYGRGKKPADRNGGVTGSLSMTSPGKGNVVRSREGDMAPNAAQCADKMSAVVPGAGDCPPISRLKK